MKSSNKVEKNTKSSESPIQRLRDIMATLRAPQGCPWDREQTHQSLRPYLLEEAYEVYDALDQNDDEKLKEELGDLLLQIVFHSQLAEEEGRFDFDDVARTVSDKLVRRHPHVFGDVKVNGTEEVLSRWESLKKKEQKGLFDGIPPSLPALLEAYRICEKCERRGIQFSISFETIRGLKQELEKAENPSESAGRILFELVVLLKEMGWEPETLLKDHNAQMKERYKDL